MVVIAKKDFIKEHKHLIELLGKFNDKRLAKEAADQAEELKGVMEGRGTTDKLEGGSLRPVFCRIGTKRDIADYVIKFFPSPDSYDTYVEPFIGGGAIYWKKEPSKHEVINDLDSDLISAYRLLKSIKSRDFRTDLTSVEKIQRFVDSKHSSDADKLTNHIVSRCNTFVSGLEKGKMAKSSNPSAKLQKIDVYQERMKNTTIENQSYEKVIQKYDDPRTFFYLDPPYEETKSDGGLYKHGGVGFDFEKMRAVLDRIKGKFLMSINDSSNIRNIFKGFFVKAFVVKPKGNAGVGSKYRKELLISNYKLTGGSKPTQCASCEGGVGKDEKPEDAYPDDVLRVLEAMSIGDELHLVGSMSLRSQQYAGDFDAYEVVSMKEKTDEEALYKLAKRFQEVVKEVKGLPDTYITDIKAGIKESWRVLPANASIKDGKVHSFDREDALAKIKELEETKIISPSEAKEAAALLPSRLTAQAFLEAKDKLKFHIVRWTPIEVSKNKKVLRDGSTMTLEEAFSSPTVTKLDCVSLIQRNRFSDFSCIYEFQNNGRVLNPAISDLGASLKEDIEAYKASGNYFKALKREFALAKYKDDKKRMAELTDILNSDLGRLYQVVSDIKTLLEVLEIPKTNPKLIRYEINQFKSRLSNIYSLPEYLSKESKLFKRLDSLMKLPKARMVAPLEKIAAELETVLQSAAKEA